MTYRVVVLAVVAITAGVLVASCQSTATETSKGQQRGLVLPTWERDGYAATDTRGALSSLASVGADWVQITPTWYQSSLSSSEIVRTDKSVSDGDLRSVIGLAHDDGLKVLLKPHVDPLVDGDRSQIDPTDREAWFDEYHDFIDHYAQLAQQLHVDEFAVGTELKNLSRDRQPWLEIVRGVQESYHGPLVYAANYSEYPTVAFWDTMDVVGIDAYWPLSSQPTTDVSQLESAFAPIRDELASFATKVRRRVLFTEAGYPSQAGATMAPWNAAPSRRRDDDEQASAYQALLATFTDQTWWAGVFWWTWDVQHTGDLDPPVELDYSVRGKPAQSVLKRWWASHH